MCQVDSINNRAQDNEQGSPSLRSVKRFFRDVYVAYAHYYVWPTSILFSTIKTDLAYDILSILHKVRFMLLDVTLGLPLHPVFHRSGEARDCFFMHWGCKVVSKPSPSPF